MDLTQNLKLRITQDVNTNPLKEYQTELRKVGTEQTRLALTGQQNSKQFQDNSRYIQQLKKELNDLKGVMAGFQGKKPLSIFQILEAGENITTIVGGIRTAVSSLGNISAASIDAGLNLKILRENFKGTAEDLQLLKTATAGTVTEAGLIDLSNQATLLNVTLEDQARVLAFVESRFDDFHGNIPAGFEQVLNAVQGSSRGLRNLRIDVAAYTNTLQEMVKARGGELEITKDVNGEQDISISKLPAQEQLTLRLRAALDVMGVSLEDAKNKAKDSKDKWDAFKVSMENSRAEIGIYIADGLTSLIEALGVTNDESVKTTGTIAVMAGGLTSLLPILLQLKIAFPEMGKAGAGAGSKIATVFGKGGIVIAALTGALILAKELSDLLNEIAKDAIKTDPGTSDTLPGKDGSLDNYFNRKQNDKGSFFSSEDIEKEQKQMKMTKEYNQSLDDASKKTQEAEKKLKSYREEKGKDSKATKELTDLQKNYNSAKSEEEKLRNKLFPETKSKSGSSNTGKVKDPDIETVSLSENLRLLIENNKLLNQKIDYLGAITLLTDKLNELLAGDQTNKILQEENNLLSYRNELQKEFLGYLIEIRNRTEINPQRLGGILDSINNYKRSGLRAGVLTGQEESRAERQTPDLDPTDILTGKIAKLVSVLGDNANHVLNIWDKIGIEQDNFFYDMVTGFTDTLSIVDSIVALFNSISSIGGGFDLLGTLLGFIPGGSIVSGAVGAAGRTPTSSSRLLQGFNGSSMGQSGGGSIQYVPYVASFKGDSREFKIMVNEIDKRDLRRL